MRAGNQLRFGRFSRWLIVGLLLLVAGAACGPEARSTPAASTGNAATLNSLVEAARKEGKLVYYSPNPDAANNALAAAFTRKYGVKVEVLRVPTTGLIQRFSNEQQSGVKGADLLNISIGKLFLDRPEWFVPLSKDVLPALVDYPKDAVFANHVVTERVVMGVTYNTDLVKANEVPKRWQDFADPRWKGRILLTDLRATPAYSNWAQLMKQTFGMRFLDALRGQNMGLVESGTSSAQRLASGAYAVGFPTSPSQSAAVRAAGAPVRFTVMEDATLSTLVLHGLVAQSPNPNAARLFLNWLLTAEGQQTLCTATSSSSPRPDVTTCLQIPKDTDPKLGTMTFTTEEQKALLAAFGIR